MKYYGIKYLILSFFAFGGCSINAHSGMHWDEFLKQPNEDLFIELKEEISASVVYCDWGSPKNGDVISAKEGQPLYRLIAQGNEFAFRAGLLVMRCLDGGELEDFYRSTGLFFEAKSSVFLRIVTEKRIPNLDIEPMLNMLPLNTVDNFERQLSIIEKRIAILEAISDNRFDNIKEEGLSSLINHKELLNRIRKEINSSNK